MRTRDPVFVIVLSLAVASWTEAATVTFDDVDATIGDVPMETLSPYRGYSWGNFTAYARSGVFTGFDNGIVSEANAAFGGGEFLGDVIEPVVSEIAASAPFDFGSAWIGAGYYDNLEITVLGRRQGSVVYSHTVTVSTTAATFVDFSFLSVDAVTFSSRAGALTADPFFCGSFNCTQFTLDDVVLTTPIPEPSRLAFLGIGAAITLMAVRNRLRRGRRTGAAHVAL